MSYSSGTPNELSLLVETAGGGLLKVTQKISRINPATLVGVGKASQIIYQAKEIELINYF